MRPLLKELRCPRAASHDRAQYVVSEEIAHTFEVAPRRSGTWFGVSTTGKLKAVLKRRALHTLLLMIVSTFALATTSGASPIGIPIADWQMNERAGAREMGDSSGSNLTGRIGGAIETGVVGGGATGYRWSTRNRDGVRPERLVTVAGSALNPRSDAFAVTVRLSTGLGDHNIVQKGQTGAAGGFWKVDMKWGRAFCTFQGSEGMRAIGSSQTLWDGRWHTVRCERRRTGVTIVVDGGAPRTNPGSSGHIENSWPVAVGGKWKCDPPAVQCDYFSGLLDNVTIERLAEPPDTSRPHVAVLRPADGSYVAYSSNVALTATALDDGGVTRVEFWVNGTRRCTDGTAPYECTWTVWTRPGTKNTVRAVAYDAAGNVASHTVSVYTS